MTTSLSRNPVNVPLLSIGTTVWKLGTVAICVLPIRVNLVPSTISACVRIKETSTAHVIHGVRRLRNILIYVKGIYDI